LKRIFVFCFAFLSNYTLLAQSQKEIDYYKSKFFLYNAIGIDSALYYNELVFSSKKPIDLAFAYVAKWQLLFIAKQNYNEKEFTDTIDFYLRQVPEVKEHYYELANIYNIIANTYIKKEKFGEAFNNLVFAQKFAELNGDFKQEIKIKSNLSIVKGSLGMRSKAIEELKKNIQLIDENSSSGDEYLKDWRNRNAFNLGIFYIDEYRISNNKLCLDSAIEVFDKMRLSKLSNHYLAQINAKLGIINNETGRFDKATQYYKEAIALYAKLNNQKEIDVIVYNLGYNFYQQKKYQEAKSIFASIIQNKKDTVVDYNYLFAHKYLGNIYTLEKKDSALYYSDKFLALYAKETENEKLKLAKAYSEIEKKDLNEEIGVLKGKNERGNKLQYLYLSIILILIAAVSFFIHLFFKTRKETEAKLNALIKKLQEAEAEDKPKEFTQQKITGENEKKIIDGLLKLEKEGYYLRKDFNLHNTAKKIGSNTTYLTAVIKTYKKMSFNEYTNELRINYILKELMVNEKLQNYTIQSLAEVVGYKNGASFSKIFKLKTGVTPFQFIGKIKGKET
jgi:YesN/AraC family two-component response regulator